MTFKQNGYKDMAFYFIFHVSLSIFHIVSRVSEPFTVTQIVWRTVLVFE